LSWPSPPSAKCRSARPPCGAKGYAFALSPPSALTCSAARHSGGSPAGRRPQARHHARRDHRDRRGGRLRSARAGGPGRGAVPDAACARQQTGERHVYECYVRSDEDEALGIQDTSLACSATRVVAWPDGRSQRQRLLMQQRGKCCEIVPGRLLVRARTTRAQATISSLASASPASCRAASTAHPRSPQCGSTAACTSTGTPLTCRTPAYSVLARCPAFGPT